MKMEFSLALEHHKKLEDDKNKIIQFIVKYNHDGETLLEYAKQLKAIDSKMKKIESSEVDALFLKKWILKEEPK
jgi:hypothetical protein